jgi:trehalose 6-phosphate synthase
VRDDPTRPLHDLLGGTGRLIVVSNRGPVTFQLDPDAPRGLSAARGPGGLVTALGELGRHAPVSWVAVAITDGDRLVAPRLGRGGSPGASGTGRRDGRDDGRGYRRHGLDGLDGRVAELIAAVLPDQDVRLHLVDLDPAVFEPYYNVVANPFLWFVQHRMYAPAYGPNVDAALLAAWRGGYRPANDALADAAVDAAGTDLRPVMLLQDYHLYLAPTRIRRRLPGATILHFNHIPWPAATEWQLLPMRLRRTICEGLLECDIVGLQTDRYASNFLDTVVSSVNDARVDPDGRTIRWRGRRIPVRTYPISVDPEGLARFARSDAVEERVGRLRERLERAGNPRLIVRADRIEPSKNALRGFLSFEELLARRPGLRETTRFLAVMAPTRTSVPEYADYAAAVREVVARINGLADPDDAPVWVSDGSDYAMAIAALRLADVVVVNPLVDGMNLVAKEAVLVGERDPALILSETAGAAEQLASDSLVVAPGDIAGTADQLERALEMPPDERRHHLRRMRLSVRHEDLRWWLDRQLRDLVAVRRGAVPPSRRLRDTLRRLDAEVLTEA